MTLVVFNTVKQRTNTFFWGEVNASLQAAITALAELNDTLETRCGREAPGLGAIGEVLRAIQNFTVVALAERQPKPVSLLRRLTGGPASPTAVAAPGAEAPRDAIAMREEAYEQLAELAELLHRLEPHSPVPYLIRSAVIWGNMTFAELVMTFSDAGLDLGKVFDVLGQTGVGRMPEEVEEEI